MDKVKDLFIELVAEQAVLKFRLHNDIKFITDALNLAYKQGKLDGILEAHNKSKEYDY